MRIVVVSMELAAAVTLPEAKRWLRVDADDEDDLIGELAAAATDQIERLTRRALTRRTLRLELAGWPAGAIELPRPPCVAVDGVGYLDPAGEVQALAADAWTVEPGGDGPAVWRFAATAARPRVASGRGDAVRIEYEAGYAAGEAPAALRAACCAVVEHMYDNRGGLMSEDFRREILRRVGGWRLVGVAS